MSLSYAHATPRTYLQHPGRPTTWRLIQYGPRPLTTPEFNAVITGITALMIGNNERIIVPGFKAGEIWTGLPWQILYDKPAGRDERLAAWMMGLMAREAFIQHPLHWYTDKTTYVGHEYPNTYYFRPKEQP